MISIRAIALKTLKVAATGVLVVVLVTALLLYAAFSPSRDVVSRNPSPSGALVATLVEINGGATTSFGYEVRIARAGLNLGGSEVASLYGAVRSDSAYGVNLHWVSDQELRVEYLTARSAELAAPRMFAPSVRVLLRPGISDPLALPGGMLYNLQRRPSQGG